MLTDREVTAKRASLAARVKAIQADTKLDTGRKMAALRTVDTELAAVESAARNLTQARQFAAGNDLTTRSATAATVSTKGIPAPSIRLPEDALRALHEAIVRKQPYSAQIDTKAAADLSGLLPSQLMPNVLGPTHEGRVLDHLRKTATSSPSIEYVRHNSTTGSAATVAPGALKPELIFNTTQLIATVRKIAAHTGATHESLEDFSNFQSYVMGELERQVIDAENAQILLGDGTGTNLLGLLNTTGILTRAVDTAAPEIGLDAIERAITDVRAGSSLAVADLIVMHPETWSKTRRTKDSTGRYLVQADPTADDASSLWGIPVVQTTVFPAGKSAVIATAQAATVHIREGLRVTANPYVEATTNVTRFIAETRLALAVERPSAISVVTGL